MKQTTKKRVTSVLAIAMTLLLAFPLGSAHVEARTELEMDDYDDIVSTYSVDDSVRAEFQCSISGQNDNSRCRELCKV